MKTGGDDVYLLVSSHYLYYLLQSLHNDNAVAKFNLVNDYLLLENADKIKLCGAKFSSFS